jgi:hypothetical protein
MKNLSRLHLTRYELHNQEMLDAIEMMYQWRGEYTLDSVAASIYSIWEMKFA